MGPVVVGRKTRERALIKRFRHFRLLVFRHRDAKALKGPPERIAPPPKLDESATPGAARQKLGLVLASTLLTLES